MIVPVSLRFIKNVLESDERLVASRRLHWIHLLTGFLWFLFFSGIGIGVNYFVWKYLGSMQRPYITQFGYFRYSDSFSVFMWLCIFTGGMVFTMDYVKYKTTKVIVTSKRVIYKIGLFHIKIDETDLSDIRAVHVDQGWLGYVLGYGKVRLDCRFVDDVHLPYIRRPYGLVKAINKMRTDAIENANTVHIVKDNVKLPDDLSVHSNRKDTLE